MAPGPGVRVPGGRGLLAGGGAAGGPQCYTGSRPLRPAPEGPHPGLQVVHSSGAGWAQGGGQTYKPTTGGTPGEDPQGACVTLLTQPRPQRRPRLPGDAGQAPARPTSAEQGRQGGCRGPQGRVSWRRNGGPQRKEVLWHPPHGQPRSLTLSLGWTPEGKERHPLPMEAGRPACPHPASGAPSHPPGRQAWGEQPQRLPLLLLRGLWRGSGTPHTQFWPPS